MVDAQSKVSYRCCRLKIKGTEQKIPWYIELDINEIQPYFFYKK